MRLARIVTDVLPFRTAGPCNSKKTASPDCCDRKDVINTFHLSILDRLKESFVQQTFLADSTFVGSEILMWAGIFVILLLFHSLLNIVMNTRTSREREDGV
jgi:hypothetical protein